MSNPETTVPEFLRTILMRPDQYLSGYVKPGWIEGTTDNRYVSWQSGRINLDGWFTPGELRALAEHVENHGG